LTASHCGEISSVRRIAGGGGVPRPRGRVHVGIAPERDDRSVTRKRVYKASLDWSCNMVASASSTHSAD
jgi:hypothetical protein